MLVAISAISVNLCRSLSSQGKTFAPHISFRGATKGAYNEGIQVNLSSWTFLKKHPWREVL